MARPSLGQAHRDYRAYGNHKAFPWLQYAVDSVCRNIKHSFLPEDDYSLSLISHADPLLRLSNLYPLFLYTKLAEFLGYWCLTIRMHSPPNLSFSQHTSVISSFSNTQVRSILKLCRSQQCGKQS